MRKVVFFVLEISIIVHSVLLIAGGDGSFVNYMTIVGITVLMIFDIVGMVIDKRK